MYNLSKYLREKGIQKGGRKKICYCRVSSSKQKEDLERQKEYMRDKFPTHEIISDIRIGVEL